MTTINYEIIRDFTLQAISNLSKNQERSFKISEVAGIVSKNVRDFNFLNFGHRRMLMMCISELNKHGDVFQFFPDDQNNLDYFFVTDDGESTLNDVSRDPINVDGYLRYLKKEAKISRLAMEYVCEAVSSYRTANYKSSSVMLGAATEIMITEIRDSIVTILDSRGEAVNSKLKTWKAKEMLDSVIFSLTNKISGKINEQKALGIDDSKLKNLREDINARLPSIGSEFRKLRNDAGHPGTLKNVNRADVHANLLLFPKTAKLLEEIRDWVNANF